MFAFGLSNHSPDQAMQSMLSKGIVADPSEVAILPSGSRLKENKKPVRSVIFVLCVSDFDRNVAVFNSKKYADVRVFIFASPLRIKELNNVVALDFDSNPAGLGLGFVLRKDFNMVAYRKALKTENENVKKEPAHYLRVLTDNAKLGSLLNPLMTFIYTLPSATHQTPVKEAVAQYLYKGLTYKRFEEMLDELRDITVTKRVRDRLKEILTSEVGENYRSAFKALSLVPRDKLVIKDKAALQAICAKYNTSDYEMSYVRSIVESPVRPKPKPKAKKKAA